MNGITRIMVSCLVALAGGPALGAPAVVDLGQNVLPQSLSNDGKVVAGVVFREEGESGVFRWTPDTGVTQIGGLLAGRPDVSADGTTIAATILTDVPEAAFWTSEKGWLPLSATGLVSALPGWATVAWAISADGSRLAGSTVPPPVDYGWERGFSFNPDVADDRWTDFGWQELPKFGKGGIAWASAISNDGTVQVGSASERSSLYFAVRWVDGRVEELRDGEGQRLGGETVVCNSDCTLIAGGGGGLSTVRPVLAWRLKVNSREPACHFQPLEGPALLHLRHYAYSTSETGNVIAGAYYYDVVGDGGWIRNVGKGFMWLASKHGGTLVDLQEYLAMYGQPALEGWVDVIPVAVSADGRYMVGWGSDPQGAIRGWLIDFGRAPRASDALPSSSSYTMCPKNGRSTTPAPVLRGADAPEWPLEDGVFQAADGRRYRIERRGMEVYGSTGDREPGQLVRLGADHYYDLTLRSRVSFVRDDAGRVTAIRESRRGASSLWWRRDTQDP